MGLLQSQVQVSHLLPWSADNFSVKDILLHVLFRNLQELREYLEWSDGRCDLSHKLRRVIHSVIDHFGVDFYEFGLHLYLVWTCPPEGRASLVNLMEVVPYFF